MDNQIRLGDKVIIKNKKVKAYNKPCIVCFDHEKACISLFNLETGLIFGHWNFIEDLIKGCKLIKYYE